RDMQCGEDIDTRRARQEAGSPRQRLPALAVGVTVTAVALPARNGHHGLDTGVVGHACEPKVVGPRRLPALWSDVIAPAAGHIRTEQGELEAVAVSQGLVPHSHLRGAV